MRNALVIWLSMATVLVLSIASTCPAQDGYRYLKNNIHAQRNPRGDLVASYANWTQPGAGHVIFPVNTPVKIGRWYRGFALITQDKGQKIHFEYNRRNMAFTEREYLDLITSPREVDIGKFDGIDREGIRVGKAFPAMSKEAVRVALGYPATHQTPTLKEDVWVYWKDRWRRLQVVFDQSGRVVTVDE
jgi:hypothetical protein